MGFHLSLLEGFKRTMPILSKVWLEKFTQAQLHCLATMDNIIVLDEKECKTYIELLK